MEPHGIEERLYQARSCSLVYRNGWAVECRKEGLLILSPSWFRSYNSRKRPLPILSKNGKWNRLCFIGIWWYGVAAWTRNGSTIAKNKNKVPLSSYEMQSVQESVSFRSTSSIMLRTLGYRRRNFGKERKSFFRFDRPAVDNFCCRRAWQFVTVKRPAESVAIREARAKWFGCAYTSLSAIWFGKMV